MNYQQFLSSPAAVRWQRSIFAGLAFALWGSLFSPQAVFAQTSPEEPVDSVPSAADLLPPAAPEPAAEPAPAPPEVVRPEPARRPSRRHSLPAPPESPAAAEPAVPRLPNAAELIRPDAEPERVPTQYSDLYIDTTRYDIGATGGTTGDRPNVVLSERSTGCQLSLQSGQGAPGQVCGGVDVPVESGAIAATGRGDRPTPGTVNIGPIQISRRGVSVNPLALQDFYNRTVRPLALAGNGNARMLFPLAAPATVTSPFGWRIHPIFGNARFHYGSDLGAPMGTPVVAAFSGQVDVASFLRGYGLTVVLRHQNGSVQTLYAHLSEIFVRPGESIQQGEVIGRVGSTGNSTGPHLHFEYRELTREGWVARDPGGILQTAVTGWLRPFQAAQAIPAATAHPEDKLAVQIRSLQDFGKLAGDAHPVLKKQAKPNS